MDSSACVGALVETRFSKSHKVIFGKSLFYEQNGKHLIKTRLIR